MTYKLDPWIEKINSMVTVILPDGTQKRYISGRIAVDDVFDKLYIVRGMTAIGSEIMIQLEEAEVPANTWIGEEQQGFF